MADTEANLSDELAELVAAAADDFQAREERGERPDPEEYAARHPHAADVIRRVLGRLQRERDAIPTVLGPLPGGSGTLGDFRIVREVGRGGMGVVYEAEQISLLRRVALKVLPFAAVMDPRHLQRFRNEAMAAAALDHPNVVKVYAVGCDRGVHYIAMQFVDGRSLAELIHERRGEMSAARDRDVTRTLAGGDTPTAPASPAPAGTRTPTDLSFARRVAEWGGAAADGLEHAHALGVVHRDIKPGNLLIDARGSVYVADFGLARVGGDGGVTGTGDLLGTPRYMSPEQASARHNLVDHRSDVYSLGATLYELLTLEPAVPGTDPVAIIRRLTDSEPTPPRALNRAIPRDLETVVMKCLAKQPERRYSSARELADDLRRFLAGEPVRAKPPTFADRVGRWAGRRWPALAGVFALLVVALGVLTTAVVVVRDERDEKADALMKRDEALTAVTAALGERDAALGEKDAALGKAQAETRKADDALGKAREETAKAETAQREGERHLSEAMKTVDQIVRLGVTVYRMVGDYRGAANLYRQAIALCERLGGAAVRPEYARSLAENYKDLGEVLLAMGEPAEAADADEQYIRLAEALPPSDFPFPESNSPSRAAAFATAFEQLGDACHEAGRLPRAAEAYKKAHGLWQGAEEFNAVPHIKVTAESRLLMLLGDVCVDQGRLQEAEGHYRDALDGWKKLDSDPLQWHSIQYGHGHTKYGELLWFTGRREDARREFRAAVETWARGNPENEFRCRFLMACPDPAFRDPPEAVRLAKTWADANPKSADRLRLLIAARFHAGHWQEIREALFQFNSLHARLRPTEMFYAAMATFHRGNKDAAGKPFDNKQAARNGYNVASRNVNLKPAESAEEYRLCAEAAELLGLPAPAPRPHEVRRGR